MPATAITYIGGPTALLEYGGLRIVTDPTFDPPSSYPDPGGLTLVKTAGPALSRGELGAVDLVLLSHESHEDNLDREGRALLADVRLTITTPLAASALPTAIGLDPWETHELGAVAITAVPALHGPPGSERRVGPVTGFVLQADKQPTVYVSGDNASLPLVEQIAGRFPEIDVAILFAGAARVPGIDAPLTLTAADAMAAAALLGAARVVVLHTEDWEHFSESRADVEREFGSAGTLVPTPRGARIMV